MSNHCRTGKILWVNLTDEDIMEETIDKSLYKKFIGGKGLGAYLLYTRLQQGIDPLSSENILIFLTGPLQGLNGPSVGRWSLVTKSPLTGLFLDTHCGGPLGREIKRAGYDALCVTGIAPLPSTLVINDGEISLDRAEHLWGKGIYKTTQLLHEEYGSNAAVYTIGPAGERQVLFATGACEIAHQTGRGGAGAVMGSKRLKAVIARGTRKFTAANPDEIRAVNREIIASWQENTEGFKTIGTAAIVEIANGLGQYPTRNWQSGYFERYESMDLFTLHKNRSTGSHYSCPNCIMRCTHAYSVTDPLDKNIEVESTIEYETLGLMGGNLGIDDLDVILQLNYLSDDLGLDTISCGSVIGFVMEAFERGILAESDLGFPIGFGDGNAAIRILQMIAHRDGIGDLLANGVKQASETLGDDAQSFAVHVKGLECAAWDPRGRKGMGLSYATAEVGASHLRGWPATTDPPDTSAIEMVESMIRSRDEKIITDSLIVCHFTYHLPLSFEQKIRLLNAATGESYTDKSLMEFALRVETLTRLFNIREGISRDDDDLPTRFWEPQTQGPREGLSAYVSRADFEACLDRFYELRGWNQDGRPTAETIRRIGLESIIT